MEIYKIVAIDMFKKMAQHWPNSENYLEEKINRIKNSNEIWEVYQMFHVTMREEFLSKIEFFYGDEIKKVREMYR